MWILHQLMSDQQIYLGRTEQVDVKPAQPGPHVVSDAELRILEAAKAWFETDRKYSETATALVITKNAIREAQAEWDVAKIDLFEVIRLTYRDACEAVGDLGQDERG